MLADLEYFRTKLSKIDGADDVADKLLQVVQAKSVANDPEASDTASEKVQNDSESTKS